MHYLHLKFFAPRLKLLQCDMAGLPLMSLPSLGVSSLDLGRHRMAAFFFIRLFCGRAPMQQARHFFKKSAGKRREVAPQPVKTARPR